MCLTFDMFLYLYRERNNRLMQQIDSYVTFKNRGKDFIGMVLCKIFDF